MRRIVPVVGLAAVLLGGCGASQTPDAAGAGDEHGLPATVRVGVIPNIAPDDQQAKYDPLRDYLEDTLGTEVELFVATNYAGVVSALVSEQVDVAYLGGLTYVQAEAQTDITPLVTEVDRETQTTRYLAAIVVKADSPLQSVEDLLRSGGSFAFGDVSSTSGSLYPRIMLTEAGAECSAERIEECPPLREVTFTGGHDATAQAVVAGSVDAGGRELRILHRLEAEGSVDEGALRPIATREVMGYPWVARTALGDEALETIQDAFMAIDDPDLLGLLRAESYEPVTAADYDEVRTQAAELGLLTQ
jgi:phosphonate transport system substrate-binding protein